MLGATLEPGFPLALAVGPAGPPTIVNVDVDIVFEPGKEIFYTDLDGTVHAIEPDGTPLPGWPRPSGPPLLGGAVAVGDLNADFRLEAVVGTADGRVFAFDVNTGELLPGFPVDVGGELVFVSVAPVAACQASRWPPIMTTSSGRSVPLTNGVTSARPNRKSGPPSMRISTRVTLAGTSSGEMVAASRPSTRMRITPP